MLELADDADLKSADCEVVWVRVPLLTPFSPGLLLYSGPVTCDGVQPSGKARDFDSRIRRFEPCHPSMYDPLAQLAEHLTFNQGVWSSNLQWVIPICLPKRGCVRTWRNGRRARLRIWCPRAYEFESHRPHSFLRTPKKRGTCGSSSVGRAPALQAGCCEFKSRLSLWSRNDRCARQSGKTLGSSDRRTIWRVPIVGKAERLMNLG